MTTKKQKIEIANISRVYHDSCSICHNAYEDHDIVYTVFGYDNKKAMQVTTACCAQQIVTPILLGACGYFDPDEIHELLESHPMKVGFFKDN